MLEWYYLVLISGLLISISTLVEKYALKAEHASAYSSDTTLLIAIVSLVLVPFADFNITPAELLLIYLMSIISTLSYLLTARAYKHGDVSASAPVLSTLPMVLILIIAFFTLHESLSLVQYALIALMIPITYILLFPSKRKASKYFEKQLYIYYLLLISVLMAAGAILLKYVLSLGVNIFTVFVINGFSMALNMAVFMTFKYGGPREMIRNLKSHPVPLASISVLTLFYRTTYYAATSITFISLVYPLRQGFNIVITVLLGAVLFRESDVARKLALALIMLVIVYLIINPSVL